MQILRYPHLTEPQFLGCLSAFVDSLSGALNSAVMYLRKLEGRPKGSAFAFEMQLDQGRYGAMVVLDRWSAFAGAFAALDGVRSLGDTAARVEQASRLLEQTNQALDASADYAAHVVETVEAGYLTVQMTFDTERQAAERALALGPMLPAEFHDSRRVFLQDLAAR